MSNKKTTIETRISALEKAEPRLAAVASAVRDAIGRTPRNACEIAVLRGLRLTHRRRENPARLGEVLLDTGSAKLEGSAIIVTGENGLEDERVLREVARWELRDDPDLAKDEGCVLMLRDMLADIFSERSHEARRRDGRVLLAVQRAALASMERDMAETLARARERLVSPITGMRRNRSRLAENVTTAAGLYCDQ